ncbi:MAG: hypothetical protein LBT02_00845 [Rickettsiales bacterium]|jgi:hypothetical protein|nr:hypothetical protein [Rickettsiales bacterium]
MSKLIVNICCLFIFKRKNRHRFRVKYNNLSFKKIIQEGIDNIKNLKVLFGVNKKLEVIKYDGKNYFLDKLSIEIKQTFFKSEIDYENRKYNNTFIVNITNDNMSGLTDQIFYSLYCIELNKRLNGKYKFIFLTGKKNGFRKYILSHYNNLKDYVDFEIMEELPNEIKYLYEKYELTSNLYKMEQIKKPPLFIDTMLREFKYIKMGGGGAFTLTPPLKKSNEKNLKQIK